MTLAVVALGSNLAPRREHLRSALTDLGRIPGARLVRASRWRETEPVDAPEQSPAFINGACLLKTSLNPRELLDELLAIETRHGRVRGGRNVPRSLDLDLVLFGDRIIDEPGLAVPHPRAHERLFVLEPAAEVGPDLRHPVIGATLAELCDRLTQRTPN
jgi:2-amino-4-hydroxy-6-hydroxymethyldihydropteridine diphosphokinase